LYQQAVNHFVYLQLVILPEMSKKGKVLVAMTGIDSTITAPYAA